MISHCHKKTKETFLNIEDIYTCGVNYKVRARKLCLHLETQSKHMARSNKKCFKGIPYSHLIFEPTVFNYCQFPQNRIVNAHTHTHTSIHIPKSIFIHINEIRKVWLSYYWFT